MFLGMLLSLKTKKTEFYRVLANWIEQWCDSPAFKLTVQTKSALVSTLRVQIILTGELPFMVINLSGLVDNRVIL